MISRLLLISLMTISCLQIANCKALNFEAYDVNEDFKTAIITLRAKLDAEVTKALELVKDVLEKMKINAKEDMELTAINLFQYEYNADKQISKLQDEDNEECIEELKSNLESSSTESYVGILTCHQDFMRDSEKIARKGLDAVGEFLRIPRKFTYDFNSCEDEACRFKVVGAVNEEISLIEKKIAEVAFQLGKELEAAWLVTYECYDGQKKKFVSLADEIVKDAEKCR